MASQNDELFMLKFEKHPKKVVWFVLKPPRIMSNSLTFYKIYPSKIALTRFFQTHNRAKIVPIVPPAFTHVVPFRARAAIFGTVDHPGGIKDPRVPECLVVRLKVPKKP